MRRTLIAAALALFAASGTPADAQSFVRLAGTSQGFAFTATVDQGFTANGDHCIGVSVGPIRELMPSIRRNANVQGMEVWSTNGAQVGLADVPNYFPFCPADWLGLPNGWFDTHDSVPIGGVVLRFLNEVNDPDWGWRGSDDYVMLSPVPEPATLALMAGGLLVLAGVVRRRARTG